MLRPKAYDFAFELIAKRLRGSGDAEDITQEPLPDRWVELIHHLNEQERRRLKGAMSEEGEEPA